MRIEGAVMKTNNAEEVRYCCSECRDEGYHLYYNIKKEVYHCFKCGLKGKQEPEKIYTDERLKDIMDILSGKKSLNESKEVLVLPESRGAWYDDLAVKYMLKRGIPEKKIRQMGCLVSDDKGFEYRIIIPIYNSNKIIYYQARGLLRSILPKYLNPIYPKREALYYNMNRHLYPERHLFITEGIFKALNLWRINEPSVAILGKEITKEQIKRIWSLTYNVTVLLDPDALSFSLQVFDELQIFKPKRGHISVWQPSIAIDDMSVDYLRRYIERERSRRDEVLS